MKLILEKILVVIRTPVPLHAMNKTVKKRKIFFFQVFRFGLTFGKKGLRKKKRFQEFAMKKEKEIPG